MGYVAEGSAILQIDGQEPQALPTGSAFHEPADAVIARFDNASAEAPMKFIAYYLLNLRFAVPRIPLPHTPSPDKDVCASRFAARAQK
jgi:hypothetical protein